ncbi:DNA polymerase III subunit delta' [Lentilactobacillus sp. SPB1-3]|uniref:DNA polymerase III subunit delta n=1 Tax=Lentilactobacillus terminaliae TaxID=3003483 RepID=A0ACD5DGC8_9LACO|nr:DNA polymerase III subunit delta' [Lentilactobacillus sp. SPB1-3]MCZ0976920.1 DNA polymerase III subunit delta' [Lentilactobacillus sp. SPB1-3]
MAVDVLKVVNERQPQLFGQFMKTIEQKELSHAYLFTGEQGAGEFEVALGIAMRLFCENVQNGYPCGECHECQRILNFDNPDVVIENTDDRSIKVDQIRRIKDEFSKSAVEGNRKVFIISGADRLTSGAANSLLKFIEEPIGDIVTILITENKNLVLPTILSRTQVIEFPHLNREDILDQLTKVGVPPSSVNLMLSLTNDLSEMQTWLKDDWFENIQVAIGQWFKYVIKGDAMAFPFIQTHLLGIINNREEQRIVLAIMVQIFREPLMIKFMGNDIPREFPQFNDSVNAAKDNFSARQLTSSIELLLTMNNSFNGNMNFQNILEETTLKLLDIAKR